MLKIKLINNLSHKFGQRQRDLDKKRCDYYCVYEIFKLLKDFMDFFVQIIFWK